MKATAETLKVQRQSVRSAEKALAAGIKAVVFDRGGYVYHAELQNSPQAHVKAA